MYHGSAELVYTPILHFVQAALYIILRVDTMNTTGLVSMYFYDIALVITGATLVAVYQAYREYKAGL